MSDDDSLLHVLVDMKLLYDLPYDTGISQKNMNEIVI